VTKLRHFAESEKVSSVRNALFADSIIFETWTFCDATFAHLPRAQQQDALGRFSNLF
jgi:hypothetical protein